MTDSNVPKEENKANIMGELILKAIQRQADASMALSKMMIENADVLIYQPNKVQELFCINIKGIHTAMGMVLTYEKTSINPDSIKEAKEAVLKAYEKAIESNFV